MLWRSQIITKLIESLNEFIGIVSAVSRVATPFKFLKTYLTTYEDDTKTADVHTDN